MRISAFYFCITKMIFGLDIMYYEKLFNIGLIVYLCFDVHSESKDDSYIVDLDFGLISILLLPYECQPFTKSSIARNSPSFDLSFVRATVNRRSDCSVLVGVLLRAVLLLLLRFDIDTSFLRPSSMI